jgi:hypothetical protein
MLDSGEEQNEFSSEWKQGRDIFTRRRSERSVILSRRTGPVFASAKQSGKYFAADATAHMAYDYTLEFLLTRLCSSHCPF